MMQYYSNFVRSAFRNRLAMTSNLSELLLIGYKSSDPWSTLIVNPQTGSTVWNYKGSELQGHTVTQVASAGGEYLLLPVAEKPLLHLICVHPRERIHLRSVLPSVLTSLAVHPDGSVLCGAIDEKIYTWLLTTGQLLTIVSAHFQPISRLRFTSDGSILCSAGNDGLLQAWNLADLMTPHDSGLAKPEPLHKWTAHSLAITDLFVCPSGAAARICTCSKDQTVQLHSVVSGETLMRAMFDCALSACCMDSAETRLFVGTATGHVVQIDLFSQSKRERHVSTAGEGSVGCVFFKGHKASISCLVTNLDGSLLASGDENGEIKCWNIASNQLMRNIQGKGCVSTLQFIPVWPSLRKEEYENSMAVRVLQKQISQQYDGLVPMRTMPNQTLAELRKELECEINAHNVPSKEAEIPNTELSGTVEEQLNRAKQLNHDLYTFMVNKLIGGNGDKNDLHKL